MARAQPWMILVLRNRATAVTQRAGADAHVGGSCNFLGQGGRAVAGGDDRGHHGILAHQVRAQQRACPHLVARAIGRRVNRHIRSERAIGDDRDRERRPVAQAPGNADDGRRVDRAVDNQVQIDRAANADGRQTGRGFGGGGQFVDCHIAGRERAQVQPGIEGSAGGSRKAQCHRHNR